MRGDEETGTVVATQIVEEEGLSRDGNTNADRESGEGELSAGESGGDGDSSEHGEPVLEVCETPSRMCRAQRGSTMRELPSKALRVLTHEAEGSRGRQRWTVRVPAGEGSGGQSDEGNVEEGQEGPHSR